MLKQVEDDEKACRLQKAFYDLKQAGRQWYKRIDEKLRGLNLIPTKADPCIYRLKQVLIYVDDPLVFYRNKTDFKTICKGLLQKIELKDLWSAHYYLGI